MLSGWTPLHVAAATSHYGIVMTLLEAGAVVNLSGDKGVTPLHDAIESGNYKVNKHRNSSQYCSGCRLLHRINITKNAKYI